MGGNHSGLICPIAFVYIGPEVQSDPADCLSKRPNLCRKFLPRLKYLLGTLGGLANTVMIDGRQSINGHGRGKP
jgi:hypothetical protein